MGIFKKIFSSGNKPMSDEETIRQIQAGGTQARRAIGRFYDNQFYKLGLLKKNFRYLKEEDLLFAYTTAVTQLFAQIEKREYDGRASLGTYLQFIFKMRCIDEHRKQKSEWEKKTLEERKEEPFPGEEPIPSDLSETSVQRVALIINMDAEQIPDLEDKSFSIEQNMISNEFIEEVKTRIGTKPWEVLLYKAAGYGSDEIAVKFGFSSTHSATQSCSAYKKNLVQIIYDLQQEGW